MSRRELLKKYVSCLLRYRKDKMALICVEESERVENELVERFGVDKALIIDIGMAVLESCESDEC